LEGLRGLASLRELVARQQKELERTAPTEQRRTTRSPTDFWRDPLGFNTLYWPQSNTRLYDRQEEILESVRDNDETFVPAGNMLGKDYVAGRCVLWFYLTRTPCRVVTTSADYSQLESVLWGEVRRFCQEAVVPSLYYPDGDPRADYPALADVLLINHLHVRKRLPPYGEAAPLCPLSYLIGRVAAKGEGMLGHHIADTGDCIPRTLWVADEASGVEDISYERAATWARRMLVIGNPYPGAAGCSFFEKYCKAGDLGVER
jgi:hypothetical protein